jgi:hypothetical protein
MFNMPIGRVTGRAVFWLQMKGTDWFCSACRKQSPKNSLLFECRIPVPKDNNPSEGVRRYLCLDCAEKLLEDALTKVQTAKNIGPEGLRMFEEA